MGQDVPPRVLVVPSAGERSLTEAVLAGERVSLTLRHSGEGPTIDFDRLRVARAVYGVVADLAVTTEAGATPSPESFAELREQPRSVTLEVIPADRADRPVLGHRDRVALPPDDRRLCRLLSLRRHGDVHSERDLVSSHVDALH